MPLCFFVADPPVNSGSGLDDGGAYYTRSRQSIGSLGEAIGGALVSPLRISAVLCVSAVNRT